MAGLSTILVLSGFLMLFSSFVNGAFSLEDVVSRGFKNRKVAFDAHLDYKKNQHLPPGTTIIFPKCSLNDGKGYDVKTGIFTAPLSGVYMFNAHVCNGLGKYMVFAIMKGNVQLARSTTYEDHTSGCGSVNTIVKLIKGDQISVEAKWTASYIWAEVNRVNSFSGFFLYKS